MRKPKENEIEKGKEERKGGLKQLRTKGAKGLTWRFMAYTDSSSRCRFKMALTSLPPLSMDFTIGFRTV